MSSEVALRPATPADAELLLGLYASTRADELAGVPWDQAQKQAFLRAQFEARQRWYDEHFAGASNDVVLRDGVPCGRLHVYRGESEIRVVEIALLPEHRAAGLGTRLLSELLLEGEAAGKQVTIHVERFNPALRLYQRLGFEVAEDKGVYLFLSR